MNWNLNVQAALVCVAVMSGLTFAGLIALLTLKARDIIRRDKARRCLDKHADWLTYILASLDGEEALYLPPEGLRAKESRIIMKRLLLWIEQVKGKQQEKLIRLCEAMGFIDLQLRRMRSPYGWVKLDAAYHLGCLRSPQAVPIMLKLLDAMKFGPPMYIVARAIAKCSGKPEELREMVTILMEHNKESQPLIADILMESEQNFEQMLVEFLQSGDTRLVKLALAVSLRHASPGLTARLHKLVYAEEKAVRLEAAKLIVRNSGTLSLERARELLCHDDWEVRALLAEALGTLGMKGSVELLKASLADESRSVGLSSGKSLARLGEEGFTALCEAASDSGAANGADVAHSIINIEMRQPGPPENRIDQMADRNMRLFVYRNFFGHTAELPKNKRQTEAREV